MSVTPPLRTFYAPLGDLYFACRTALWPTIRQIRTTPSLLLRPKALSDLFMSYAWELFGNGVDMNCKDLKEDLIGRNATGIVLDIGAGHGHSIRYFSDSVTSYIALEPNVHMHSKLRDAAKKHGYSEEAGTLLLLSNPLEEIDSVIESIHHFVPDGKGVDAAISIMTLCSVPPKLARPALYKLTHEALNPGGKFLAYEHVLNETPGYEWVAWLQRMWSPIWGYAFGGCRLDVRGVGIIKEAGESTENGAKKTIWAEEQIWKTEGEDPFHLFGHLTGRFVKVAE